MSDRSGPVGAGFATGPVGPAGADGVMAALDPPLSEAHEMLRSASARFIAARWPMASVRALADDDTDVEPGYLAQAGELGWFAALIPEEWGGGSVSGSGILDAVVIAGQRGRDLEPAPFVPTNVAADTLVREGTDEQRDRILPAVARGEATIAWALADRSAAWDPGRAVRWTNRTDGFVLSGSATLVHAAGRIDWILVTAGSEGGISQFLVPATAPGVGLERSESIDPTRRFYTVVFDDVPVGRSELIGGAGTATESVERQLQLAAGLTVAETVGTMERELELTVAYAKDRIAFGRPIGSFQAVKHLLADTSLLLEASKAVATAAARALADGVDAAELTSVAKAYVGDSAIQLGQNCAQVFAGIGFTWAHDHHFYLRRLTLDSVLYGDPAWHRSRIGDVYGLQKAAR